MVSIRCRNHMITLDLKTFQQSREGGNVTGVIYVDLESGAFPGTGWSDFPVIILSWWSDALFQLETRTRREVVWQFMDGPQSLTLTKLTGTSPGGALTFEQLENDLLDAAKRVVAHCERHKLLSNDLDTLRMNVGRLGLRMNVERKGNSGLSQIEIRPSVAIDSYQ